MEALFEWLLPCLFTLALGWARGGPFHGFSEKLRQQSSEPRGSGEEIRTTCPRGPSRGLRHAAGSASVGPPGLPSPYPLLPGQNSNYRKKFMLLRVLVGATHPYLANAVDRASSLSGRTL